MPFFLVLLWPLSTSSDSLSPSSACHDTFLLNPHGSTWNIIWVKRCQKGQTPRLFFQLWKITIFTGKIDYKWPFSIAMLVYQRVHTGFHGDIAGCSLCFSTQKKYLIFGFLQQTSVGFDQVHHVEPQRPAEVQPKMFCSWWLWEMKRLPSGKLT